MITTVLLSFKDDINSTLNVPIGPLSTAKALSRTSSAINMIRKACGGLLEAKHPDSTEDDDPD